MKKTRTLPTHMIPIVGLLVLVGVFSNAPPALADCPLPPGVTPPADPRVTAQQVEDGSATLMDFALAVRERSREYAQGAATAENAVYIGCIIRQEDGIWRSGSTYIVSLTLDGRVYIHAKNMALSGRLLNPLIYGAILLRWAYPQPIWRIWRLPILLPPPRLLAPSWAHCCRNRMAHSTRPPLFQVCHQEYQALRAMPLSMSSPI